MSYQSSLWAALLASSLASCSFLFSYNEDEFEARQDGSVVSDDGGLVRDDGGTCLSASPHIDTCETHEVGPPLELLQAGEYVLDTDTMTLTAPSGSIALVTEALVQEDNTEVLLVFTSSFGVGGGTTLRARGTRALVIIANETIVVEGTIDVSSRLQECTLFTIGAGANPTICVEHEPQTGSEGSSGAGAGFGSRGGNGQPSVAGGPERKTSTIRGGCNGGRPSTAADLGGLAGGAIGLVSKTGIAIRGSILASGSGGFGGFPGTEVSGGGGGASGGMIDLSAPSISLAEGAQLVANGGGGGGGEGRGVSDSGAAAQCGEDGNIEQAAAGGAAGATSLPGGAGGEGSGLTSFATQGAPSAKGGHGGGGGGGGWILVHSPDVSFDANAIISPRTGP